MTPHCPVLRAPPRGDVLALVPMREALRRARYLPVLVAIAATVASVATVTVWDTERESKHAVERLALAQASLAQALVLDLESRMRAEAAAGKSDVEARRAAIDAILADSVHLSTARQTLVFVGEPPALAGPAVPLPARLNELIDTTSGTAVIPREDAAAMTLPDRRAVAAWQYTSHAPLGVLVVASAELEREYAEREELISVASMLVVVGLVLALGVNVVRRDTERVRLEHALERQRLERERDEQLARAERIGVASALSLGIAHELATPLGVIAAKTESLRRHLVDERSVAGLAVVAEQLAQMRQVMQGFLSLARGDSPQTAEASPEAIARAAAAVVLHRYSSAGVHLVLDVPGALPPVAADETLVRQALANLLVNAAQASPPGASVTLRLVPVEGQLEFHVIDQGHGISPELADQVLRPFVSTRASAGGSGLGLAIAQELARHHGGTVSIHPAPSGKGTHAVLRLPLAARSGP